MEGYYVPDNNWMFERVKTFWSNTKKENIIEYEARKKSQLPSSSVYSKVLNWSVLGKQGRFTKSKRNTLIDQILQ